jgi:methyltransferase-like protein
MNTSPRDETSLKRRHKNRNTHLEPLNNHFTNNLINSVTQGYRPELIHKFWTMMKITKYYKWEVLKIYLPCNAFLYFFSLRVQCLIIYEIVLLKT